jgi:hypothetical protein
MYYAFDVFKNLVRTSKRTKHVTITKISWIILFQETIAVYSENPTKHINTLCGQETELFNAEARGATSGLYMFNHLHGSQI